MKSNFIYFVTFAVGAAIGSAATWQYVKTKYEQIAQEEIDQVREYYSSKKNSGKDVTIDESMDKNVDEKDSEELEKYKEVVDKVNYSAYSQSENKEVKNMDRPYVISPQDFDENDYEVVTLYYFDDGYLTDADEILIDDIESMVTYDALTRFGEYEDDSVYVRDDEKEIDYEILRDNRNYADVINKK